MSIWSTGPVVNEHRAILHNGVVWAVANSTGIASHMVRLLNDAEKARGKGGEDHDEAGAIHGADQGR